MLTGLAERFPDDPEPEYVSINASQSGRGDLQENNHIVIVDLATGRSWATFPPALSPTPLIRRKMVTSSWRQFGNGRREPDAIPWTPGGRLLPANEGDYADLHDVNFSAAAILRSSRSAGEVLFEAGAALEREAVRHGHYPDERSPAKGIEPEGVAVATYHDRTFLFEGTEDFGAEGLTKNLLIRINADGSVAEEIKLPDVVNQQQRSNGFEEVMTDPSGRPGLRGVST